MVQKLGKRRGRPRSYDPELVLTHARDAFWRTGFAATSLDDLSAATGLNRPSLYAGFGDKRALYLAALERYRSGARAAVEEALAPERPLAQGLRSLYALALSRYLGEPALGCFLVGTAATEAVEDPAIRAALGQGLRELDEIVAQRFRLGLTRGELALGADPEVVGRLATGVLHTLAIRARAGESREVLEGIAEVGVRLICAGSEGGRTGTPTEA